MGVAVTSARDVAPARVDAASTTAVTAPSSGAPTLATAVPPVGNGPVTEPWLLRFRFELVAHAEARLDERVPRGVPVDLLAQPPNEHVDRAVAVRLASPPHLLQQLVARDDTTAVESERVEELELGWRQLGAAPVDERLHFARVDAQLLDLDRIATPLFG